MNQEEILQSWEKDCIIDDTHLDHSSIETSKLHSKYLRELIDNKKLLIKLTSDYKTLKYKKFRYYRGEMSKEELDQNSWVQWEGLKPLKTELEEFVNGDSDIIKILSKIEYVNVSIELLNAIFNQLKSRDWQIKNSIQWKMFISGN